MRHGLPLILLIGLSAPVHAQSEGLPQSQEPAAEPDLAALGDLFPNGAPSLLTPESIATSYRVPAGVQPPDAKRKLPTGIDYSDGPMKVEIGTKITTNKATPSIIPQVPDPNVLGGAAGGGGELKGQVRYSGTQWEFYGAHRLGVTQADGAPPSAQESTTFGSTYKLPDWMVGGKIGASLELAPANERKTRVEYRRQFGPAEGFIAAERSFVPDRPDGTQPPAAVRGGLTRKF